MEAVAEFAAAGGAVLGICNGFQVLCEAGLLPGALLLNQQMRFVCRQLELVAEGTNSPLTSQLAAGERLSMPAKHGEGRYFAPAQMLEEIEANGQVAFRYAPGHNPNGSAADIAGVLNRAGNVLGMMPHPEHAVDPSAARPTARAFLPGSRRFVFDDLQAQPTRSHRPRVRTDRRAAGAPAKSARAGDVQPAVVRALRLQALSAAAAAAAHRAALGW